MAYVIAHGTINGWHIFPLGVNGPDIDVVDDIRAELNTTINSSCGYLLRHAPNGVWFTTIKVMIDGERSGKGMGFFAISAYVPSSHYVSGAKIKEVLDATMNHYLLSYTDGIETRSIGVNWSFLQDATNELDSCAVPRCKLALTSFKSSSGVAFVQNCIEVSSFFDKPFQPDYCGFRAVFLSDSIMNMAKMSSYTALNIDLDDILLNIVWRDHKGDPWGDSTLLQSIRKKEIPSSLPILVNKPYYKVISIRLSDFPVNEVDETLTVTLPKWTPEEYTIQVLCEESENIDSLCARNKCSRQVVTGFRLNDTWMLTFLGESLLEAWELDVTPQKGFRVSNSISFVPDSCKSEGIHVKLERVRTISLQILRDGQNKPEKIDNYDKKISILTSPLHKDLKYSIDKSANVIQFSILESENFTVELKQPLLSRNTISVPNLVGPDFYSIIITERKTEPVTPSNKVEYKTIYIKCGKGVSRDNCEIQYHGAVISPKLDCFTIIHNEHRNKVISVSKGYVLDCPEGCDEIIIKKDRTLKVNKELVLMITLVLAILGVLGGVSYFLYRYMNPAVDYVQKAEEYLREDKMILSDLLELQMSLSNPDYENVSSVKMKVDAYVILRKYIDGDTATCNCKDMFLLEENDRQIIRIIQDPATASVRDSLDAIGDLKNLPLYIIRNRVREFDKQIRSQVKITQSNSQQSSTVTPVSASQPSAAYTSLKRCHDINVKKWNAQSIANELSKYNDNETFRLQQEDVEAYKYLQKLKWLSCRKCIDECNWKRLKVYAWSESDPTIKNYIPNDAIREFIRVILDSGNLDQLNRFASKIKQNESSFKRKSFLEVKKLWEDCKVAEEYTETF